MSKILGLFVCFRGAIKWSFVWSQNTLFFQVMYNVSEIKANMLKHRAVKKLGIDKKKTKTSVQVEGNATQPLYMACYRHYKLYIYIYSLS